MLTTIKVRSFLSYPLWPSKTGTNGDIVKVHGLLVFPSSPALSPAVCIHLFCTRPSIESSASSLPFSRCLFRHHSPPCVLVFPPRHVIVPFRSSLRYLFRCLRYFRRSSNVFVPDLILPGHPPFPPPPSLPPHSPLSSSASLINLNSCFTGNFNITVINLNCLPIPY